MQGALLALNVADEVLLGSYAVAGATARYIRSKKPETVSLVAMGWEAKEKAPEDEWCALYFSHLLGNGSYDHNDFGTVVYPAFKIIDWARWDGEPECAGAPMVEFDDAIPFAPEWRG